MTWMQTASGKAFDLAAPTAEDIDFPVDVAGPLARQTRYAGQVQGGIYSIAQHSVLGCDAMMQETGRPDLAAAFLLHDGHEAYIGDEISPVTATINERQAVLLQRITGRPHADRELWHQQIYTVARDGLKGDLDAAIFLAAGARLPRGNSLDAVKSMDIRMLRTERDHLMVKPPRPWAPAVEAAEPIRLRGRITVWPWPRAADEWMARLRTYCPQARGI